MPGDDEVDRPAPQQPDPAGAAARSMSQLAQQMKEMADRMLGAGLPGWPVPGAAPPRAEPQAAVPPARQPARPPAVPGMPPMPATMSARQMQAIVDDVTARRTQVQALVVQLEAFDEQLGTLENSLRPLLSWLQTWSDLEGAVTDFWTPRPPGGGQGTKR